VCRVPAVYLAWANLRDLTILMARKPNWKAGCAKACRDQSAQCSYSDDQGLHSGSELPLLTGVQCHHGLCNRCDLTANVDSVLTIFALDIYVQQAATPHPCSLFTYKPCAGRI
jgi:hypothetical protein